MECQERLEALLKGNLRAIHGSYRSCGDSAALLLNDGQEQILTRHQYKNPPIGSGSADPVAFSSMLGRVWKVVMMSDGVWKYAGWDHIWALVRQHEGEALIQELRHIAASNWGGKLPDDFSLAVLQSL